MFDEQDELNAMYEAQPGLLANPSAPPRESFRDKLLKALAAQYRPQAAQPPTGVISPEQQRQQQQQQAMGNIGALLKGIL